MAQSPDSVLKDIKAGQFAPLYFLQGEEPYFIDRIADLIEQTALVEHERGFNQTVLYGKDTTVGGVITNARRFPMMAERQVVIVKEAQELPDLNREEGQRLLENYALQPVPSTILVLAHKHKSLDGRKGLAKALDKHAVLVESKKLYDNKLPDWITGFVKEKGVAIPPDAVQLLADSIGADLGRLASELEKLLLNVPPGQPVTADLVSRFVGISREYNVFELQKALAARDPLKAQRIVAYFEANAKANPLILIITNLFGYFSKILLVHGTPDKSEKTLAPVLGVNPFFVKDYLAAARAFNLPQTIRNIRHLRQADLHSKGLDSGSRTEGDILKELVFKLLH